MANPLANGVLCSVGQLDFRLQILQDITEYLGVLRSARGTGVARSLLNAVIVEAAERGRDRVGLEVDADSTGAVDLYTSTGFHAVGSTQSWHRDLPVGETKSASELLDARMTGSFSRPKDLAALGTHLPQP